ncbi:MAG: M28 family peptidase [Armatimonadetes bacterium]|nr:M28 family peptidase [Armatimonadota bacterium]
MRRTLTLSILSLAILASAQTSGPKISNSEAITSTRLRAHLEFVAHDLLEGRDTPSRGLDIACEYVATQLKLWGVKPGGDAGTYFQKIAMYGGAVNAAGTKLSVDGKAMAYGTDYYASAKTGTGSGELVFVGYGAVVPAKGIDAYKGVDVKGKIVVMCNSLPKDVGFRDLRAEGAERPADAAAKRGAAGIMMITSEGQMPRWENSAARSLQSTGFRMEKPTGEVIPTVTVPLATGQALLPGKDVVAMMKSGEYGDPIALGKSASMTVSASDAPVYASNVVGIVEGTDKELKAEYIALGAHIDHVGMGGNGPDKIFNGADDDGSGTVSILEIAHAFATGPKPKRSIIFVWHCGEEKGLWGSAYFTNNPTVPIKSIQAQLNIDMIGRSRFAGDTNARNKNLSGPDSIYVIGSERISRQVKGTLEKNNKNLWKIDLDYKYDLPGDTENFYQRSDHYNYAAKGIPIAFFFDGVHEDYHQVGDEAHKIDYRKMARVAQTVYAVATELGNMPDHLKHNGTDIKTDAK